MGVGGGEESKNRFEFIIGYGLLHCPWMTDTFRHFILIFSRTYEMNSLRHLFFAMSVFGEANNTLINSSFKFPYR